jgi:hypothetical protein
MAGSSLGYEGRERGRVIVAASSRVAALGVLGTGLVTTSMTIKTAAVGAVDPSVKPTTRRRSCRRW